MDLKFLNHPMVTKERWNAFTPEDHRTWQRLFERQEQLFPNRAADEILSGMESLGMCAESIPRFVDLNKVLKRATGFSLIPVTGLVPQDLFFKMLSHRLFPSTCFIRTPEQFEYLEQPDIFHDVFGHVPLLVNPIFADFMELFGRKGLEAEKDECLDLAGAFYWFTVEFGLIQTPQGLRMYGAGIASSPGETIYSLESPTPLRRSFELKPLVNQAYRTDVFQTNYFVIEKYEDLFHALKHISWPELRNIGLDQPMEKAR